MVVDFCKSASVMEHEDGTPTEFDDVNCQTSGQIPPFNEYLNVNTPLQIGGMAAERFDPLQFKWSHTPLGKPFNGCIRYVSTFQLRAQLQLAMSLPIFLALIFII